MGRNLSYHIFFIMWGFWCIGGIAKPCSEWRWIEHRLFPPVVFQLWQIRSRCTIWYAFSLVFLNLQSMLICCLLTLDINSCGLVSWWRGLQTQNGFLVLFWIVLSFLGPSSYYGWNILGDSVYFWISMLHGLFKKLPLSDSWMRVWQLCTGLFLLEIHIWIVFSIQIHSWNMAPCKQVIH